jgi:hypothetical protein
MTTTHRGKFSLSLGGESDPVSKIFIRSTDSPAEINLVFDRASRFTDSPTSVELCSISKVLKAKMSRT